MSIIDRLKNWPENRRRTKEIELRMQAQQGKAKIRRHMLKQEKLKQRLWELGKRALRLGNEQQFRQSAQLYLRTLQNIKRGEQLLLTLDAVEVYRDQAHSTVDFMQAVQAMSQSILASASPRGMAEMQRDLELAVARAQSMEERLGLIMEMTDQTVFAPEELGDADMEAQLRELERAMQSEAEHEEGTQFDERIEEGLKRIEEEMKKELR